MRTASRFGSTMGDGELPLSPSGCLSLLWGPFTFLSRSALVIDHWRVPKWNKNGVLPVLVRELYFPLRLLHFCPWLFWVYKGCLACCLSFPSQYICLFGTICLLQSSSCSKRVRMCWSQICRPWGCPSCGYIELSGFAGVVQLVLRQ